MSLGLLEYLERVGQMWDDEIATELTRVNAAIHTVKSKAAGRPLYSRRRVLEAVQEARKGSVEIHLQSTQWRAVSDALPDADEAVLGIDSLTDTYSVVSWDGEAWGDAMTHDPRTVTHWMRLVGVLAPPANLAIAGGVR